jgi:low affinity Fe/Cu permease
MLRLIAAVLVILWFAGLLSGYTMDLFIHILIALAIILLVISINLEVSTYRDLTFTLHNLIDRRVNSGETGL